MIRFSTTPLTINDIESFANAGAEELIFGTEFFSTRAAATFSLDEYQEIRNRCNQVGVGMMVLVNRFFVEEELPKLKAHLLYLKELNVDGIYFSDEAVLYYGKELGLTNRLIYQPDTLLTNHLDVNEYLAEGLQRVVLAKEITLAEIKEIAANSDPSCLELILHGRVVMMHSKRPLLSNYMEFTHQDKLVKNNPHLMIEEETRHDRMPILEDEQGTHVFSAYVLNSFQELQEFLTAGIGVGRIDGIFHTSEEILTTLRFYDNVRKGNLCGTAALHAYQSQFPHEECSSGFYYRATSTTK